MFFIKEEIKAMHVLIQVKEDNTPRLYDLSTRRTAESIFDKIMETIQDDSYVDAEIDFTTQEKALLLTYIPVQQSILDGKMFDKLLPKLQ